MLLKYFGCPYSIKDRFLDTWWNSIGLLDIIQMTVKDTCGEKIKAMTKRQTTDLFESDAKYVLAAGDSKDGKTSNEMIGTIFAATRTPHTNIVEFSDDIPDIEITPGPEPLSDSDIHPRLPEHKKQKHKKAEKSKKLQADNDSFQKKDGLNHTTSTNAEAT